MVEDGYVLVLVQEGILIQDGRLDSQGHRPRSDLHAAVSVGGRDVDGAGSGSDTDAVPIDQIPLQQVAKNYLLCVCYQQDNPGK